MNKGTIKFNKWTIFLAAIAAGLLVFYSGDGAWKLTSGNAGDSYPSWSPDGTMIVFASNRSGADDIWIMSSEGKNLVQLTNDPYPDTYPLSMKKESS